MNKSNKTRAFTLFEMLAVVAIIMVMIGLTALTFARSRPSVKVKNDAAQMVSFLRNMWDRTKTSGAPLMLNPDYEKGRLSYSDPRTGTVKRAKLSTDVRVIGILLNDRYYNTDSHLADEEEEDYAPIDGDYTDALFISEGRGLTRIAVAFAILKDEEPTDITMAVLNLITGKGTVQPLDSDQLAELATPQMEVSDETY